MPRQCGRSDISLPLGGIESNRVVVDETGSFRWNADKGKCAAHPLNLSRRHHKTREATNEFVCLTALEYQYGIEFEATLQLATEKSKMPLRLCKRSKVASTPGLVYLQDRRTKCVGSDAT
jgi:hypothetical protein